MLNIYFHLFHLAIPGTYELICYQFYDTSAERTPPLGVPVTCEPDSTACMTKTTISQGRIISRYHYCSFGPICQTMADQDNSSFVNVQNCCYSDFCNNGTIPPFEEAQKYCYAASCTGENCLSNLLTRIDRDNLGTFCNANGLNCWRQMRTDVSADGTLEYKYMTGCDTEDHNCFPYRVTMTDHETDRTCCDGHLCNGVDFKTNDVTVPGQSYCYEYYCISDDHHSCHLRTAIDEGKADVCPMTNEGCYFVSYYGNNKATHEFRAGCFTEGFQNETQCTSKITKQTNYTSVWHCCDIDRCTDGRRHKSQSNQCYSVSCVGDGCLEESVKSGNCMICNKSKFGCEAGLTKTNIDSIYSLGCSKSPCVPGTDRSDNFTVIGCCEGDRCLPDNLTSGVATCLKLFRLQTCMVILFSAFLSW